MPGGWVLNLADEGGMMWYHYGAAGEDCDHENDVLEDAFGGDIEAFDAARGVEAWCVPDLVHQDPDSEAEHYSWELRIYTETVFEVVDPDPEDVWAAAAEALARYDAGEAIADVDVTVASGTPRSEWLTPPERAAKRKREREQRRREENQSLGDFAGGGA